MDSLVDKIRQGDRRSLAKAMSLVDQEGEEAERLKDWVRQSTGRVPWWGFTGPPGVGKSTLIDTLVTMLRERGRRIGVVAVDPTSPLSHGALLGDRVRMMRHAIDRDVFIRSLATHRRKGGLSDAALHCARLLEWAGYDPVLIETVGVGQNDVDIASVADICVVLLGPGYGDDIQLTKAGLLEIADLVVVNKCDLPDATRLLEEVRAELGLSSQAASVLHHGRVDTDSHKKPADNGFPGIEVLGIEAKSGKGVGQLLETLLDMDGTARQDERRQRHTYRRVLGEIIRNATLLYERALERELTGAGTRELIAKLQRGETTLEEVVSAQLSVISGQFMRDQGTED